MAKFFDTNDPIFKNEDVLRDDWQPNELREREAEIDEYRNLLKPVVLGRQPRNIFLYGKTGTGKTAVTDYITERLEEDSTDFDFNIHICKANCNTLNSSYQVAVTLVNKLRDPDDRIKTTGYPTEDLYAFLWEEIEKLGGTVLFVLDEVDNVMPDDDILYEIPRARSNGHVENARPGIIGISNDLKIQNDFSPKVRDTLCEETLHFKPYETAELQTILEERKDKAFKNGILESNVIEACAAFAAQDTGSARQALTLLFEAGDKARRNDETTVTVNHVEEAKSEFRQEQVKEGMRNLTRQGHIVLTTLLKLEAAGETPARTRRIQKQYRQVAKSEFGSEPHADRVVLDHLNDLDMLGIARSSIQNRGKQGGRYREFELDVELEAVLEALEDELWGFPEIRARAGIDHQEALDSYSE